MIDTLTIGYHEAASDGFVAMLNEALSVGGNTFAMFLRNPRSNQSRPLDSNDVAEFRRLATDHRFGKLVAHAPYIINACGKTEALRDNARQIIADDLARLEALPGNFYNFHPGNHVGQGVDAGIAHIGDALNAVITPAQATTVLLETMAGKGTELGGNFAELAAIIARVSDDKRGHVGVCLDTCHVWDAGYNLADHLDEVLGEFDATVGLDRLRAIHLNDSKNPCGVRKDRHACLGEGNIGWDALARLVNHPRLRRLPFILETPNDHDGYAREIATLRAKFVAN